MEKILSSKDKFIEEINKDLENGEVDKHTISEEIVKENDN